MRVPVGVTPAERVYLAYRDDRADYADWITTASLPASALDRQRVVVDSLADLADVAIDTGERVVHDAARGAYVVVHDEYAYTFQPPADPREAPDGDGEAATADAAATDDQGLPVGDAPANALESAFDDPATFGDDVSSNASGED